MDEQPAQVVDAVGMVGVLVGVEHGVDPIDLGVEKLLAQVGRCVDQHARDAGVAAALHQERCAAAAVLRVVGIGVAPAERRAWHAARGAAAEDREAKRHAAAAELAAGRGTLLKRRKKLSVVCRAISSKETPRVSASTLAVSTTKAGSLRWPRCLPGAR